MVQIYEVQTNYIWIEVSLILHGNPLICLQLLGTIPLSLALLLKYLYFFFLLKYLY